MVKQITSDVNLGTSCRPIRPTYLYVGRNVRCVNLLSSGIRLVKVAVARRVDGPRRIRVQTPSAVAPPSAVAVRPL